MAEQSIPDDIRKLAAKLGLDQLSDAHLQQFMKASRVVEARRASLDTGSLVPSDEPSHVYRPA